MKTHKLIPRKQLRKSGDLGQLGPQAREEDLLIIKQVLQSSEMPSVTPGVVMQLQRTLGNHATQQIIKQKQTAPTIQRNPIKEKLQSYIDEKTETDVIRQLARHILTVINLLEAGRWQDAYNQLTDESHAKAIGASIKVQEQFIMDQKMYDATVYKALKTGKFLIEEKKLTLPSVIVMIMSRNLKGDEAERTPANDPELARLFLPVMLEEWIHMFQHEIKGFLSEATYTFSRYNRAEIAEKGWNLNEVDIYAIYRDLHWDTVLDAFRERYKERQKFEEFEPPVWEDADVSPHAVPSGITIGTGRNKK